MLTQFTEKFIIKFKNPYEFLVFYDDDIRLGKETLYDWQKDILIEFGKEIKDIDDIHRIVVLAANGSGKSKYILAPCIAWIPFSFDYGLSVVTSSSAVQLDTQTERYLNMLIDRCNATHFPQFKSNVWNSVKRHKEFIPTGGHIDLFATDEAVRAEGKHPLMPGSEFAIFVDEGKSINEDIYGALMRCKGFTRRMDVSSPGNCFGHLYDVYTRAEELKWKRYRITAFDCKHIRHSEIENDILKYGIHDPLVRSSIFSEFTSIDSKVVIPMETLLACMRMSSDIVVRSFGEHSGLDLSAGGDEMVLSVWDGNVMRCQEFGRYRNTVQGTNEVINWIQKHRLDPTKIWADDGGIGRGIIDQLHDKGYMVRRVLNNHRAYDNSRYSNLGTENWFNFKRYIEEGLVKIIDDSLLKSQLSNRYYKTSDKNLLQLESKDKARANGHPSPDRADAAVLAWMAYRFPYEQMFDPKPAEEKKIPRLEVLTEEQMVNYFRNQARKNFELLREFVKHNPIAQMQNVSDYDENNTSNKGGSRVITQSAVVDRMLGNTPLEKARRWLGSSKHRN